MLKYFLPAVFTAFIINVFAQEAIVPLNNNPYLQPKANKTKPTKNKGLKDIKPLQLPFIDDFSDTEIYPNDKRWLDKKVYINNSNAINPISIGVATFDAINEKGQIYAQAGYSNLFSADTLTSFPINLDPYDEANQPFDANTIFLSFYFQAQGKGDAPEERDELTVEFYSPKDNEWTNVWTAKGRNTADFEKVMLKISESKYLDKKFQFRFINKVSLSGNMQVGRVSNCDFWNIDYVVLDKNRSSTDKVTQDLAFVYPLKSFLAEYEAMPWKHYKKNKAKHLLKEQIITYRNNDKQAKPVKSLNADILNLQNNKTEKLHIGSFNLNANSIEHRKFPFNFIFDADTEETAKFKITANIETDDTDPDFNNHTTYWQKFENYYSYDDGTAEMGWGLTGEGTKYAEVAYKFTNYDTEDKLIAVNIFFNKVLLDINKQNFFILKIWTSKNGKPDKIIYEQLGLRPKYKEGINKFVCFDLEEKISVTDTFFVGWQKTKKEMLNVGYDTNRDATEKLFYNIDGTWKKTEVKTKGALMLRPIFGKKIETVKIAEKEKNTLKVFPNPCDDEIFIKWKQNDFQEYNLTLFDIYGRKLLYLQNFSQERTLNTTKLKDGIYFIVLKNKTGKTYTRKIAVKH